MPTKLLGNENSKRLIEYYQMSEIIDNSEKTIICLNCGTECHDKFCPHCGQSTAVPSKLRMKNFGKGVLMSFGRLTPGFFNTAKNLMFRPWDVIRDHIHGRHIRYSPPITMLIQVFLYVAILYALVDGIFGTDILKKSEIEDVNIFDYQGDNKFIKLLDTSIVLETLFWSIPICFCIYLGFYRHGAKKYNFAEYLAAFCYMYAAITIYDSIFNFAMLIPGINLDVSIFTYVICGIFSVVTLIKAFPQNKWWKYPILFLWTAFLIVAFINILNIIVIYSTGYSFFGE